MKNLIKIIVIIILVITPYSCSDDYFDVDRPTNAADLDQLGFKDILPPAIFHTVNAQYIASNTMCQYSQHIASFFEEGVDSHFETTMSGTWNEIYLRAVSNLKVIENRATTENALHYRGVSRVLIALNLGLATDSWGDIPYSEAFLSEENLTPVFDSQESIYVVIQSLLSNAISDLEAADTSPDQPGNDDLIYGGDIEKWIKAAYTLKARYELHLTKRNGTAAATAALTNLASGFSSNEDDMQLNYNDRNLNPWHTDVVLASNTGNFSFLLSDQLVSFMNGSSYPFNSINIDPRLPIYADKNSDPDYRGGVNGSGGEDADGGSANAQFADEGFYSSASSPIVLISYAEALFIKAEAEFLVNGGSNTSVGSNSDAYQAYLDGINANMDKLGVDEASKNAYLADTSIDLGEGDLMLQNIMREKFIALFLNAESFVDYRRYDFSQDVFKDLELPALVDPDNNGEWVRRVQYPSSEEITNSENVNAVMQTITTPVWWDQ